MSHTIESWIEKWLTEYLPHHAEPKTVSCYADAAKRAFRHSTKLPGTPLTEFNSLMFQEMLDSLAERYARSSVNHVRACFKKAYDYAQVHGFSDYNPCARAEISREARTKEILPLTQEEQSRLENALVGDSHGRIAIFFLRTGLRRHELINLTWEDWNENESLIRIRKSKTDAGRRIIPLSPEASMILAHYRLIGRKNNHEHIFTNSQGNPLTKSSLDKMVLRLRKKTGIAKLSVHVLRHTFATRAIERGMNVKALSKILGHTSVAFTYQQYVSPDIDFLRKEMCCISNLGAVQSGAQLSLFKTGSASGF